MVVTLTEASGFKASDQDQREYVSFKRWIGDTSRVYVGIYKYSWTNTTKKIDDYDDQTCCVIFTHFQKGSKIHGFSSFHVRFFLLEGALVAVFDWVAPLHQAIAVLHQAIFHQERCLMFADAAFCDVFFFPGNEWKGMQKFDKTKNLTMGTNHCTLKDMIIFVDLDVQVPHVNHSIFENTSWIWVKKQTMPNKKWKMLWKQMSKNPPSLQVFLTQKQISQISLFPSRTWSFIRNTCSAAAAAWVWWPRVVLRPTSRRRSFLLGVKGIEKSWKIMKNHGKIICFHGDFSGNSQLFPPFFWLKNGWSSQIKRWEVLPLE